MFGFHYAYERICWARCIRYVSLTTQYKNFRTEGYAEHRLPPII